MFKSTNHKDLSYFDIRLKLGHKNTILVKGNEFEVDSVPVSGSVKILTKEDLHVKKVKLQLIGEYQAEYYERMSNGYVAGQVSERNCVLKVLWPKLLTSSEGELQYGDYGDNMVKMHKLDAHLKKSSRENSVTSLSQLDKKSSDTSLAESPAKKRPSYSRTKSLNMLHSVKPTLFTIPRSGIDGTPYPLKVKGRSEAHSFLLPQGNYSMPFSFHLPANVSESVDCLPIAKLRYKLVCTIERGRLEKDFTIGKHVRIVRTLHPQSVNLVDLIEFGNTWPGKLEFNVSLARKALALGTKMPIKLVIVPLIKGLSFKSMYAEIVQHNGTKGLTGESPQFEAIINRQKLDNEHTHFDEDHWVVKSHYRLPNSLKDITQTCTLKNDIISVKHRVRVLIHIRNADGHVSELRANLPVHVFMSPKHGTITTRHYEIDNHHGLFSTAPDPEREDVVFPRKEAEQPSDEDLSSEDSYAADREEDNAPPVYQQHVFDMIYDQLSPRSPLEQLRINGVKSALEGYFDIPLLSSGTLSPPLDVNVLLKVPSYEKALDDDSEGEEPAPGYVGGSVDSEEDLLRSFGSLNATLLERSVSMSDIQLNLPRKMKAALNTPPPRSPMAGSPNGKHQLRLRFSHKPKPSR